MAWDCREGGLHLRKEVRDQIAAAVRRCSRFPVARIERVAAKEHPPAGTVAALTLVRGRCSGGEGDVFWVNRRSHGWRVLKKVGGWGAFAQY
jgi:hypothetical protein